MRLQMLKPPPQDADFDPQSCAAESGGDHTSIERRRCNGPH